MAKGGILEDTFEQLVELGSSTTKKSAQQVAQTFNPLNMVASVLGEENSQNSLNTSTEKLKNKKVNSTRLDFNKLQEKFKDKEKMKMEGLRNRLFQIVKREDEKILERKDLEEAQKKRQEEYAIQEKKRKEQEKKQQQGNIPTGRIRRSIFSTKKTVERQHAELKPATGKQ